MKSIFLDRRKMILAAASAMLGGCQVVPKAPPPPRAPMPKAAPTPSATSLPSDQRRHRVALLLPMSGENGAVGQSIANATTMALLDTNAQDLRITTYDTAGDPQEAARRAIDDGAQLILGPLMSTSVGPVAAIARPANVPVVSFSNDAAVSAPGVFIMGHLPGQSITRSISYLAKDGKTRFGALIPEGDYGKRAEAALKETVLANGAGLASVEQYSRGNTSIISAAQRLRTGDRPDAVLIADAVELASRGAAELRKRRSDIQIIGTELWSGENSVVRTRALDGALFSAVSDGRYRRFRDSYDARFGSPPFRIATLGYDAVLLTLKIANDWPMGSPFPAEAMYDRGGFLGSDGAFRFQRNGLVERAMEVRQIRDGKIDVVDQAPETFAD